MNAGSKIYIAGHRGMVGSAIVENLFQNGYTNLLTASSSKLDLRDQMAVSEFIRNEKPDVIIEHHVSSLIMKSKNLNFQN